jgi:hypothetical protein
MKDEPTLYKVVDTVTEKNVADNFTQRSNAEQFINYHKSKQTECENKSTGNEKHRWNYLQEQCVKAQSGLRTTEEGSTTRDGITVPFKIKGEWKYNFEEDRRDGGARYNGPAAGTSVVMVGYFTMDGGSDDVSAKLLGGRHTSSNTMMGTCYDLGIETNTGRPRLRVECPHHDMSDNLTGSVSEQGSDFMGKWVGMMAAAIQEPDGVRVQYWQDQGNNESTPTNQWKLLYEYFDTGQNKPGEADDSRFPLRDLNHTDGTAQNTWRIDESPGLQAKWLAVAEIDVG